MIDSTIENMLKAVLREKKESAVYEDWKDRLK
jgi:hypothetical protein